MKKAGQHWLGFSALREMKCAGLKLQVFSTNFFGKRFNLRKSRMVPQLEPEPFVIRPKGPLTC